MAAGRMINGMTRTWWCGACLVALGALWMPEMASHARAPSASSAQSVSGLVVTPSSRQAQVAAQLKGMRPGERVLVFRGFADDIASRDTIRVTTLHPKTRRPSTRTIQSPWLDRGMATVSARVSGWLRSLARQGAQVDGVEILAVDPGVVDRLAKLTHPHLRSIASDRRYAGLMSQYPELADVTAVIAAGPVDSLWSRAMARQVDAAVIASVGAGARQAYPKASVEWWTPEPSSPEPALAVTAPVSATKAEEPVKVAEAPAPVETKTPEPV